MIRSALAFGRLSRPHFLLGGVLLHGLGAAFAQSFDLRPFVIGQVMVTTTQLTAHYANEYGDREADRAIVNRTFFSGGSGAIPEGRIQPSIALRAGQVTSLIAAGSAIALAAIGAPAAGLVVIPALTISWFYSVEPVRLLSTGWGEVATSVVVVVGVPLVGLLGQGGIPTLRLWAILAPLVAIHVGMMLMFSLPDLDSDRQVGKRVLAVRLGRTGALKLAGMLWGIALLGLVPVAWALRPWAPATTVAAAVFAAGSLAAASAKGSVRHGWSTALAVGVLVLSTGGLLVSLMG